MSNPCSALSTYHVPTGLFAEATLFVLPIARAFLECSPLWLWFLSLP